jgi:hypothetical protein
MPLFRRGSKESAAEAQPAEATQAALPRGTDSCMNGGCSRQDGVVCSYQDRRGRHCTTTWCPDHYRMVGGNPFCPRHAGIMTALALSPQKGHLPDLDNRAPSLANWVGNDLDGGIRELLRRVLNEADSETIIVEPVGYVYTVHDKAHRWERAWKLANHTGVTLKIAVDVDEANDASVRVRVGQQTVTQATPPWVEHHQRRERVEPATDARERSEFYASLLTMVTTAVGDQRHVALRPYIGMDTYRTPTPPS